MEGSSHMQEKKEIYRADAAPTSVPTADLIPRSMLNIVDKLSCYVLWAGSSASRLRLPVQTLTASLVILPSVNKHLKATR